MADNFPGVWLCLGGLCGVGVAGLAYLRYGGSNGNTTNKILMPNGWL